MQISRANEMYITFTSQVEITFHIHDKYLNFILILYTIIM